MLDHGLIASHASKALFFLSIQTKSGDFSYHEDFHSFSPSAIQKLCQNTNPVVQNAALLTINRKPKALGTQTVSQPPRPHRSSAANTSLPPAHVPLRSSSVLQGRGRSMPSHKRQLLKISRRQLKCRHFSSIDGMLASASASDSSEDLAGASSWPKAAERRSHAHFSTPPKRKRPSLPRSSTHDPSSEPWPAQQRLSCDEATANIPISSNPRSSTSLPPTRRPSTSSPAFPTSYIFPTTTLAITHHPASLASSSTSSPAKRPSLHEPHTFSWTSDATRRLEYAKIDRAYSGLRGFCRRVLPGMCFRNGRRNFWDDAEKSRDGGKVSMKGDGDDDGDSSRDGDSVRRVPVEIGGFT